MLRAKYRNALMSAFFLRASLAAMLAMLCACGGGGGNGPSLPGNPAYTLGGVVNGLSGSGLKLSATYSTGTQFGNGTQLLDVGSNGEFHFPSPLVHGQYYAVSVAANPLSPLQVCTVSNDEGVIKSADISNVMVNCANITAARFAYIPSSRSANIQTFAFDANSGGFAQIAPDTPVMDFISSIAADPAGRFVFASGRYDGSVFVYQADTTTGNLRLVEENPTNGGSITVAIDPTSRYAYVGEYLNQISAWKINPVSGALTPITSVDLPPVGTNYGYSVNVIDPLGRFVFAANATSISSLRIDDASGALSNSAVLPLSGGTIAMAVEPQGKYVYVLPGNGYQLIAYAVDAQSGALTPASTILPLAGDTPTSIAIDPAGKFLYVSNAGSRDISAFAIDAASGALTALAGGPIAAKGTPSSITIDPYGKFAYVLNGAPENTVAVYTIDASGTLVPFAGGMVNSLPSPLGIALVK
jgi:6-phosphogluconolactonase (cycloisomerase 2 family)